MTISSTVRKSGPFNGNGVVTSFTFEFKVFAKTDLKVVLTLASAGEDTTLVLDSDYSVLLNPDQNSDPGGTVTYPISGSPLATGDKLTIVGDLPELQPTDITNLGGFFPDVIEDALDRLTILQQQSTEQVSRTLQFAISDTVVGTLPPAAARANNLLGFDQDGNVVAVAPVSGSATELQALLATLAGAGLIGNNPAGGIAATTVQAALNELDGKKVSLSGAETISGAKTFSQSPALPTAALGDASAKAANTEFVAAALADTVPRILTRVRQAVQYGPMTTPAAGQPAQPDLIPQSQIGNTLAAGVTLKCGTTATLFSVANGNNADGSANNLNWLASADIPVANLTAGSTNYIWVDTVARTAGFVTVADADQPGGAIPVTSNKYTFDTVGMKMYLGNGTTVSQVNRLIVAEVDTSGSAVTSIRVRSYNGEDVPVFAGPLPAGSTILLRTNAVRSDDVDITMEARCETADIGYSVGDIVTNFGQANAAPVAFWRSRTALGFAVGTAGGLSTQSKSTAGFVGFTQASWSYRIRVKRRWGIQK